MNIPDILQNLDLLTQVNCRPGTLKASTAQLMTPQEVIEQLKSFGGEGWYCGTDQSAIRILPNDPFPDSALSWPVSAELVNGTQSLHLFRDANHWVLTRLEEIEDVSGQNFLLERSYVARSNLGKLRYQVSWTPQKHANQVELRPAHFRFLGFIR